MVSVPIAGPGGRGGRLHGGGAALWRHTESWEVGRENVVVILVEAKKEGKRRNSPVLDTAGYTAVLFLG